MKLEDILGEELYAQVAAKINEVNVNEPDKTKHVRFADLSQRAIDELCRFPSLFVPEADGYHCKIGEDQTAYLGLITKVKARDDEVKIYWEKVKRFDLKLLSGYEFDLGFKDVDSAVSELNRTHWAVKQIDLITELQEIGINFLE